METGLPTERSLAIMLAMLERDMPVAEAAKLIEGPELEHIKRISSESPAPCLECLRKRSLQMARPALEHLQMAIDEPWTRETPQRGPRT